MVYLPTCMVDFYIFYVYRLKYQCHGSCGVDNLAMHVRARGAQTHNPPKLNGLRFRGGRLHLDEINFFWPQNVAKKYIKNEIWMHFGAQNNFIKMDLRPPPKKKSLNVKYHLPVEFPPSNFLFGKPIYQTNKFFQTPLFLGKPNRLATPKNTKKKTGKHHTRSDVFAVSFGDGKHVPVERAEPSFGVKLSIRRFTDLPPRNRRTKTFGTF